MADASIRLPGHTLLKEGMPYVLAGEEWVEVRSSWTGRGRCSCGEYSDLLRSDRARKRWHREHKDRIRRLRELGGTPPKPEAVRLVEEALHLRMYGEYAPGGTENWRDWDRKAEKLLRELQSAPKEDA